MGRTRTRSDLWVSAEWTNRVGCCSFCLFVCFISGILFLVAFVISMIKYQAKADHMDVEETKQGL